MRRLICFLRGHQWKEDRPLSLEGLFAAAAVFPLWVPPATWRRCGKKNEPMNNEYAESNGWYAKLPWQERAR
jgi:hypothetical protein